MKVLITGCDGQLGKALIQTAPSHVELLVTNKNSLDITNPQSCKDFILFNKPDWIINAAAYTSVDRAEEEVEKAFLVNSKAPKLISEIIASYGGKMLHISTDFVFNGRKSTPYLPSDPVDPLSIYGKSKAQGESFVLKNINTFVLRTSWVYSDIGNNFLLTMMKLHKLKEGKSEPLNVVYDQIGTPTNVYGLSRACWGLLQTDYSIIKRSNIYHWSDLGVASWYDFAIAIGEIAAQKGLIKRPACVKPISYIDYNRNALCPSYSVLESNLIRNSVKLSSVHWQQALSDLVDRLLFNISKINYK